MKKIMSRLGWGLLLCAIMIGLFSVPAIRHDAGKWQNPLVNTFSKIVYVGFEGTAYAGNVTPDYICDGTADQVQINQAITDLSGTGGKVQLMAGTYNVSATITMDSNIWLAGVGKEATRIETDTAAISIITSTGTVGSPKLYEKITDLTLDGNAVSCYGIKWTYVCQQSEIANVHITSCLRNGLLLTCCWDGNFYDIFVEGCGNIASTYSSIVLTGDVSSQCNNLHFFNPRVEDFYYRAIEITATGGGVGASLLNTFYSTKIHGDDGTDNRDGIYVAGDYNSFFDTSIGTLTGAYAYDGIVVANGATGNSFITTNLESKVRYGVNSDGDRTTINGLSAQASTIYGAVWLSSNAHYSAISNVHSGGSNSTALHVDAYNVEITNCDIATSTDGPTGIQIDGSGCGVTACNVWWAGSASLYAVHVTGDYNRIESCYIAGNTAAKATIDFPAGADENIVLGCMMDSAVVDGGSGNIIEHNNVY
jgi:hypothetical protein